MNLGSERGEMPAATLAPERFRDVIGHFASGVTVVTTRDGEQPLGTTASAVSSLSLEPPMLLACLKQDSATRAGIAGSGRFAVNILSAGQEALAARFATKGAGKFDGVEVAEGPAGMPLIVGALAHVECAVADEVLGGTHSVFLGSALGASAGSGRPLAYFRGRFGQLHEGGAEDDAGDGGGGGAEPDPITVRSAVDARLAIEIGAATLAAQRVEARELAALGELNEQLRERYGHGGASLAEWLEEDGRFHERLVALAGSSDLVQAHRQARAHRAMAAMAGGERARAAVDPGLVSSCCGEHRAALQALESGDAAALVAAMRHHLEPSVTGDPAGS